MSDTLLTPNVNYKSQVGVSGSYTYLKVYPSNITGSSMVLDPSSQQPLQFKLGNIVFNLSKSRISYRRLIPAAGASNFIWEFVDSGFEDFASCSVVCQNSTELMTLNYLSLYSSLAKKYDAKYSDFNSRGPQEGVQNGGAKAINFKPFLHAYPAGAIYDASAPNTASTDNEPRYTRVGGAPNTALRSERLLDFGSLKGTILASERDLFFNDTVYINLMTNPSSKVAFASTSATAPDAASLVLPAQPILSDICLYLAVQQDDLVVKSIQAQAAAGKLEYQMLWTVAFRNATLAGAGAIQLNLTSQHGRKVKRVRHAALPASETLEHAHNASNYNGTKIISYQTSLDSQPLQPQRVNCLMLSDANPNVSQDDWRLNREVAHDSAIRNSSAYQLSWLHQDSFCDPKLPMESVDEGLSLLEPKMWSLAMDTAVNLSHYSYVTFQRTVRCTPAGTVYV